MFFAAAVLALLASPVAAQPPPATKGPAAVDALVARALEARGGLARLRALKTLRVTGTATFGGGDTTQQFAWGEAIKRGGMIRDELTQQGLTILDVFDGREAWQFDPTGGRREVERQSADQAKARAQDADLDGPLVDWREKGHRVEALGTEDVDGTLAIKLRVSLKDGDTVTIYLDPDSFLEIRETWVRHVRGVEQVSETDLGSYDAVDGVLIARSLEQGAPGRPRTARFVTERLEANVAVDDALFRLPAPGVLPVRAVFAGPPQAERATLAVTTAKLGRAPGIDSGVLSGLSARNIGSAAMSGRVAAVEARTAGGKTTVFVAAASGGVWRSRDGGTTFKPVFDAQPVQSIGALALDPGHADTVWAGTGEAWTRNSVSVGDGIYKSTDGGETWVNKGLPHSERIARIAVNPVSNDTVYACVPGKLWSDSPDRGLYKTTDGGDSWDLVLTGPNYSTGCASVTLDAKNPEVLLASLWDFRRQGWTFRSGGEGPDAPSASALFRSADGGRSWTEIAAPGLPPKPWGRVDVTFAPSNPQIVYAVIESAKDSGLYRSTDGGLTWEPRDRSQGMVWRPFYFARLVVDPSNPERLFKAGGGLIVSEDGGRSFSYSGGRGHGDWHDVWIDPENPKHLLGGDDGGFWLSHDGGSRWWKSQNLPISQFYHVSVDDQDPYQVYGGLQDNSNWVGDSSFPGGITNQRWDALGGGDGFYVVLDPSDPQAVYVESQGGYIERFDRRTRASRDVQPKAKDKEKLRFNWNAPIAASPTDHQTVYLGAQLLFRTRDRGDTWERISPDLTTNDPKKQQQEQSGGVTVDNSSAEMHTTIYSISESPLDSAVIWVGTDDGNVQLTRDAGQSWTNLARNVKGLPAGSWVSHVEASRHDKTVAYATFDRHTVGDLSPWVYRTGDFGTTWTRIVAPDSGVRGYAHVLREDSVKPGLLFLGTEFGLFVTLDGGKVWAAFKGGGFPAVAVRDLQVQARTGDLVLATHGRGLWIIDDLSPLRALTPEVLAKDAAFLPAPPVQQRMAATGGWVEGDATFVGPNPAGGATVTYYQRARHLLGPLKLEVFDAGGKLVDTLTASKRRGLNRVSWPMQVKPPRVPRGASAAYAASVGPRVLPGTYTVRLTRGAQVVEGKLEVVLDRRAPYSLADRTAQFEAAMRVHALFQDMSALGDQLDAATEAARARGRELPAGDALAGKLDRLVGQLAALKKQIVATKEGGAITGEERLREHADLLYGALLRWEGRPGRYQVERIDTLRRELDEVKAAHEELRKTVLVPLNQELEQRRLAPLPAGPG